MPHAAAGTDVGEARPAAVALAEHANKPVDVVQVAVAPANPELFARMFGVMLVQDGLGFALEFEAGFPVCHSTNDFAS
ncbi:MAG: hypothetical protein Q7T29_07150 [Gallionella sp.]|nr:hypothetical protein [Gallionella sp.]